MLATKSTQTMNLEDSLTNAFKENAPMREPHFNQIINLDKDFQT